MQTAPAPVQQPQYVIPAQHQILQNSAPVLQPQQQRLVQRVAFWSKNRQNIFTILQLYENDNIRAYQNGENAVTFGKYTGTEFLGSYELINKDNQKKIGARFHNKAFADHLWAKEDKDKLYVVQVGDNADRRFTVLDVEG